jgi:hypothetical protein
MAESLADSLQRAARNGHRYDELLRRDLADLEARPASREGALRVREMEVALQAVLEHLRPQTED